MKRIQIDQINKIYKRRFELKSIGLEIMLENQKKSYYFAFDDEQQREQVYQALLKRVKSDCISELSLEKVTQLWQQKKISNYDYLMHLNHAGNRSFSDLSQYPVFPWVLSNFESETIDLTDVKNYRDLTKPCGALNPKRLAEFKFRQASRAPPSPAHTTLHMPLATPPTSSCFCHPPPCPPRAHAHCHRSD